MRPEVSVCTMVYNTEKFVAEALDSILAQTFADFEFVIVDDGSTDSTPEILAAYAARDSRIRVIRQENAGATKARNRSIIECSGELIALFDPDDIADPSRLERQVAFMRANPAVGLLGSSYDVIDENGAHLWTVRVPTTDGELRRALWSRNILPPSTAMLRRRVVETLGVQDEHLPYCQDHDYWLRIALRYEIASLVDPLLSRRHHQETTLMANSRKKLACAIEVRRRAIRLFDLPWRYHLEYLRFYPFTLLPGWAFRSLANLRRRGRARRAAQLSARESALAE